jgi:hypothetical protein
MDTDQKIGNAPFLQSSKFRSGCICVNQWLNRQSLWKRVIKFVKVLTAFDLSLLLLTRSVQWMGTAQDQTKLRQLLS